MIGEDREFVGHAVAVGVFADGDAVVAFALRLHVVGIVEGFGNPAAAALVEGHGDGFFDLRLGGEKFDVEAGRDDHVLDGFLGR